MAADPWAGLVNFNPAPPQHADPWAGLVNFNNIPEGFELVGGHGSAPALPAPIGEAGAAASGEAPGDIERGIKETIVDPYVEGASGHPGALNLAGPIYGLGNILRRSPESPAAQLASDVGMSGGLPDVPTRAPPSAVEQFLNEADVATARAAGAKTRGQIDEFIRNKGTANAPRIGTGVPGPQGSPLNQPESVGQGALGDQAGIQAVPDAVEPGTVHPAASRPPMADIQTEGRQAPAPIPEGFELVNPVAEPTAQPNPPLGLRPVDIDPQAAAAATQHEAAGVHPDIAYERAVIEAALADPKVQAIDDGSTLPTKLPDAGAAAQPIAGGPAQNALAEGPEPSQGVTGAGAGKISTLGQGARGGQQEPASGAEGAEDTDGQRAFIARDIARQATAAGRPADEAEAAGQLWAARFAARAASLGGARGTAEDLYRAEGPQIEGPPPAGNRSTPARAAAMAYRDDRDAGIQAINQAFKEQGLPSPGPENNAVMAAAARLLANGTVQHPMDAWEQAEAADAAYGEHLKSIGVGQGREMFQREPAPPFHSAAAKAVENFKQDKAMPGQWLATLNNTPGVKPEEMKWLGVEDWLKDQKGLVTKQQIADYVRANQVEVKEVEKGPNSAFETPAQRVDFAPTKFGSYTLPGGENYRELLLTLPPRTTVDKAGREAAARGGPYQTFAHNLVSQREQSRNYKSAHWDEPNVLAHIRFDDRTVNGERALHLAEVQSDWHQEGRRKGYQLPQADWIAEHTKDWFAEDRGSVWTIFDGNGRHVGVARKAEYPTKEQAIQFVAADTKQPGVVPDAPFKTTWPELAMKRMIRYAAEHGYDRLTWDTGDTNADRYDLSKQVESIETGRLFKNEDHKNLLYRVYLHPKDSHAAATIGPLDKTAPELADLVGKEMAEKIIAHHTENDEGRYYGNKVWSGLDLKVGGEGMRGFYDRMLPAAVNKLTKKFGGKVEDATVKATNAPEDVVQHWAQREPDHPLVKQARIPVHSLKLTPPLEDAALGEGFPLFQGARGKIKLAEGNRPLITLMRDANASTLFHEGGHEFLDEMMRDAAHPAATEQLKDDVDTTLKWLGAKNGEDLQARHHERFARGFEQYLREGNAPSAALARVFEKFKAWLTEIYKTIKGLGKPINDDIRRVFDRLLAEKPVRKKVNPNA